MYHSAKSMLSSDIGVQIPDLDQGGFSVCVRRSFPFSMRDSLGGLCFACGDLRRLLLDSWSWFGSSCAVGVHAGDVEGDVGESELISGTAQPSRLELAHDAWLF
jgi:hypothetical protein